MKIVLLGYMGSGKSTVGKMLGQRLAIDFIDLDDYVESAEGMSIAQIFKEQGEIYFRKKETEYLLKALDEFDDLILSLGGGTPCYGENMNHVLEATKNVIYLKVSIPELTQRLQYEKEERPLIQSIAEENLPEFIGKHLFERSSFYQKANFTIDCNGKDTTSIAVEIEAILV